MAKKVKEATVANGNAKVLFAELEVKFDSDTKNFHKYVNNELTKEIMASFKNMIVNINPKTNGVAVYQVKNGAVVDELNIKIKFVHGIGNK